MIRASSTCIYTLSFHSFHLDVGSPIPQIDRILFTRILWWWILETIQLRPAEILVWYESSWKQWINSFTTIIDSTFVHHRFINFAFPFMRAHKSSNYRLTFLLFCRGVGFLSYYSIEQLPNFALALPTMVISTLCIKTFFIGRIFFVCVLMWKIMIIGLE